MEENEYRSTYHKINERRCLFEKTINSRRATCEAGRRFNLADREGVACDSEAGNARCKAFLELLRRNANFALQQPRIAAPLPHAKEIKVQTGGLLGLQRVLRAETADAERVENIAALLLQARNTYQDYSQLPFTEIIKSIVSFEGRRRRPRNQSD